jgi:hypothetical protein
MSAIGGKADISCLWPPHRRSSSNGTGGQVRKIIFARLSSAAVPAKSVSSKNKGPVDGTVVCGCHMEGRNHGAKPPADPRRMANDRARRNPAASDGHARAIARRLPNCCLPKPPAGLVAPCRNFTAASAPGFCQCAGRDGKNPARGMKFCWPARRL